jgi:ABC-type phosphate transport system permease subunit
LKEHTKLSNYKNNTLKIIKMKNLLKVGLILSAIVMFTINFTISSNKGSNTNSNLVQLKTASVANAEEICEKGIGDPMYGTSCVVYGVFAGNYYYTFDTQTCADNCDDGGTTCCYFTGHI